MKTAIGEATLVLLACAALYLPGIGTVPFYTRGEPREGLVVQEMLRTREWLVPARPAGEPARKPPLYYWTAAAVTQALPDGRERAMRLPSALFATAAVVLTWATARAAWGAAAGLPAALVLASAFEWTRAATSARVDMALAAPMTLVLAAWTLALRRGGLGWPALAVVGAALGTLAKGPVALVLPAIAAAGLLLVERRRGAVAPLRPVIVLGTAAVLASAWYAIAFTRQGEAFAGVVASENWRRFLSGADHEHGLGYLIGLALVGLLPWTPILPLALVPLRRAARTPVTVLLAGWFVGGLVFFSVAASKRGVYLLSLYPAVGLLVGAALAAPPADGRLRQAARIGATLYLPGLLILAVAAGLLAAGVDVTVLLRPWLKPDDAAGAAVVTGAARAAAPLLGALAAATFAGAIVIRRAAARDGWRTVVLVVAALAVAWTAFFNARVHPVIGGTRSLRDFLAHVDTLVPPDAPLHVVVPADPGLRFYAPRALQAWRPARDPASALVLLWGDERQHFELQSRARFEVLAESDAEQPGRGRLALVRAPAALRTGSRSP